MGVEEPTEVSAPRPRDPLESVLAEAARSSGLPHGVRPGWEMELAFLVLSRRRVEEDGLHPERLPALHRAEGSLLQEAGRLDAALEAYRRAEAAALAHGSALEAADSLSAQGVIHRLQGRPDEAERVFARAWGRFVVLGCEGRRGMAEQEGQLGLLAMEEGDWATAASSFRRALRAAASVGDSGLVTRWTCRLADALTRDGCGAEAADLYERLLAEAASADDRSRVPLVAGEAALSYRRRCRPEDAARVLLWAADQVGDAGLRAELLERALEDLAAAREWVQLTEVCGRLEALLRRLRAEPARLDACRAMLALAGRNLCVAASASAAAADPRPLERHLCDLLSARGADVDALHCAGRLVCDIELAVGDGSAQAWEGLVSDTSLRHRVLGAAVRALAESGRPFLSLELSQRWKVIPFTRRHLSRLQAEPRPSAAAVTHRERLAALTESVSRLVGARAEDLAHHITGVRRAAEDLREAATALRGVAPRLHAALGGDVRAADLRASAFASRPAVVLDWVTTAAAMVIHVLSIERRDTPLRVVVAPRLDVECLLWLHQVWAEGQAAPEGSAARERARHELARQLGDRVLGVLAPALGSETRDLVLVPDTFTRNLPLELAGPEGAALGQTFTARRVDCLQALIAGDGE